MQVTNRRTGQRLLGVVLLTLGFGGLSGCSGLYPDDDDPFSYYRFEIRVSRFQIAINSDGLKKEFVSRPEFAAGDLRVHVLIKIGGRVSHVEPQLSFPLRSYYTIRRRITSK